MRRLAAVLAALVLAGLVAPTPPADAASKVLSVSFDGEITLWSNSECFSASPPAFCQPRVLWAPTSPNPACSPVCPVAPAKLVFWGIDDGVGPPGGGVPCTAVTETGEKSCFLTGIGAMHLTTSPVPGPYCYSAFQGTANFTITIGGAETIAIGGVPIGVLHTWPTLRWTLADNQGLNTLDQGVGTMTIVQPRGNCGLEPPSFEAMHEADVTGTIAWAKPL